jgi:UDP-N-acetyl-D-galactosamine dehydrogenase
MGIGDRIVSIGFGYVGLPVALVFAKKFPGTIGFDSNIDKVNTLEGGVDPFRQISNKDLKTSNLYITTDSSALSG